MKFLGEIFPFGGASAPTNSHLCDGTVLNIEGNEDLYDVIGANYGGDGETTFGLPDLRSRSIVGAAGTVDYPLTAYPPGSYGGQETIDGTSPIGNGSIATDPESGSAFNTQSPFLAASYCIVTVGANPYE